VADGKLIISLHAYHDNDKVKEISLNKDYNDVLKPIGAKNGYYMFLKNKPIPSCNKIYG
jgi:hypothetical protein